MKSYPVEFRQKILGYYYNEPISQKQLAKRFCVALSFLQKLLKQYPTEKGTERLQKLRQEYWDKIRDVKDLVDLCHPIKPYQVTKNRFYIIYQRTSWLGQTKLSKLSSGKDFPSAFCPLPYHVEQDSLSKFGFKL